MTRHECPGLSRCVDHPKWTVVHGYGLWFAYPPHTVLNPRYFRTWREAYDFARVRAFMGDAE